MRERKNRGLRLRFDKSRRRNCAGQRAGTYCPPTEPDCHVARKFASHSEHAWNTGSSSPGELEINAQHLRGCGLLFQRFAEIVRALLQLIEQARVLDGNDGLGSEVAQ